MNKSLLKKNKQLGMTYGKASNRLVKDLLFNFVQLTKQNFCYRCNKELYRDDFSIEHKENWLDSVDPVGLFFDLKNISFSHKNCNYKHSRKTHKKFNSVEERVKYHTKKQTEKRLGSNSSYNVKRREQRKKLS